MIERIPAEDRHFADFGWLQTYWLFSFAHYYDPRNIQFGALRVYNDDVVASGAGFPTHPHEEMEIITVPLQGELTHKDSMGNKHVIRAGDVQRMSAGTGLTHSEYNLGTEPVRFYQIWIFPDQKGLAPTYDQKTFSPELWKNRLMPIASGQGHPGTVMFHTDAAIYRCELDEGQTVRFDTDDARRIFIYNTQGRFAVNGEVIRYRDQARIDEVTSLEIVAEKHSDFMLIDVPSCKGWGYDDKTLRGAKA